MEQIDTDGDGTVDFAEFVAMLRRARSDDVAEVSGALALVDQA